jgi:biopolymer transport protein ExbD
MSRYRLGRSNKGDVLEPIVNLTPLIDVVFGILIIFIVIAPLLELDQITLADSSHTGSNECLSSGDCSPIAIQVQRDNAILLNGKKVSLSELQGQLRDAKLKFPGARPQLFHDKQAQFGTYQSIKNIVEISGFTQMDIVLKP